MGRALLSPFLQGILGSSPCPIIFPTFVILLFLFLFIKNKTFRKVENSIINTPILSSQIQ